MTPPTETTCARLDRDVDGYFIDHRHATADTPPITMTITLSWGPKP